jgi:hypothetical protein
MSGIDRAAISRKHFAKPRDIEVVPPWIEWRQILFRESKQSHGRGETPSVFRVGRMFVMFLQMHERPRRLDQPLEILGVLRRDGFSEPNLFQDIVRLIVPLFVPAPEKGAVIRVRRDAVRGRAGFVRGQRFNEPRNPLAFAHGGLNLGAPAMMGKRRPFSLREERMPALRRRSRP